MKELLGRLKLALLKQWKIMLLRTMRLEDKKSPLPEGMAQCTRTTHHQKILLLPHSFVIFWQICKLYENCKSQFLLYNQFSCFLLRKNEIKGSKFELTLFHIVCICILVCLNFGVVLRWLVGELYTVVWILPKQHQLLGINQFSIMDDF